MAVGIDTQIGLMHDMLQNPIIVSQTQLRCLIILIILIT